MARLRARALAVVALSAVAGLVCSCDVFTSVGPKGCDMAAGDNPMTPFDGGSTANGVYTSSPWDRRLVYFPGGMQISFAHGLGVMPTAIQLYVAFSEDGIATPPGVAQAAGNQAVLIQPTNEQFITVTNQTCTDYWLIVTAEAGGTAPPAPGG